MLIFEASALPRLVGHAARDATEGHVFVLGHRYAAAIGAICGYRATSGHRYSRPCTEYALVSSVFLLVSPSTLVFLQPPARMVRPRDRAGKRKATSPTTTPELEEDAAALRQHRRPAGEPRSKARAERNAQTSRGRGLSRRASPPPKRARVIEFTSSEDEAIPVAEDSGGAPEKEQSTRYVLTLLHS